MSGRQPENDAAALAALQAHDSAAAGRDLHAALASADEPQAAKRYASRALVLVGHGAQAAPPVTQGAAVEHLSYALAALRADDSKAAAGHLMEASPLTPVSRPARDALAAIAAHDNARAVTVVDQALRGLRA